MQKLHYKATCAIKRAKMDPLPFQPNRKRIKSVAGGEATDHAQKKEDGRDGYAKIRKSGHRHGGGTVEEKERKGRRANRKSSKVQETVNLGGGGKSRD